MFTEVHQKLIGVNMPCPFLSRLPGSFIKNYATPLLKMYADQCPVISRAVSINNGPHYHQELSPAFRNIVNNNAKAESLVESEKADAFDGGMNCPFLKDLGQDGTKRFVKPSQDYEIFEEASKGNIALNQRKKSN